MKLCCWSVLIGIPGAPGAPNEGLKVTSQFKGIEVPILSRCNFWEDMGELGEQRRENHIVCPHITFQNDIGGLVVTTDFSGFTIWLFNIAMENPQNKWRFRSLGK
jgi:hypothetical protein